MAQWVRWFVYLSGNLLAVRMISEEDKEEEEPFQLSGFLSFRSAFLPLASFSERSRGIKSWSRSKLQRGRKTGNLGNTRIPLLVTPPSAQRQQERQSSRGRKRGNTNGNVHRRAALWLAGRDPSPRLGCINVQVRTLNFNLTTGENPENPNNFLKDTSNLFKNPGTCSRDLYNFLKDHQLNN